MIIDVQHIAQVAHGFQHHSNLLFGANKKAKGKTVTSKKKPPTSPEKAAEPQATVNSPNPLDFTTDWRTQPEYNPDGVAPDKVAHPFPEQRQRMAEFKDAADRLAAHAEQARNPFRIGDN